MVKTFYVSPKTAKSCYQFTSHKMVQYLLIFSKSDEKKVKRKPWKHKTSVFLKVESQDFMGKIEECTKQDLIFSGNTCKQQLYFVEIFRNVAKIP